jgi:hypothetical protein
MAVFSEQAFIEIDSLLRTVYGHAKQGASYGHTKIAGKQVLRKELSPLATTISTGQAAPMIAGMRLRAWQDRADGCPGDRHRPRSRRHPGWATPKGENSRPILCVRPPSRMSPGAAQST